MMTLTPCFSQNITYGLVAWVRLQHSKSCCSMVKNPPTVYFLRTIAFCYGCLSISLLPMFVEFTLQVCLDSMGHLLPGQRCCWLPLVLADVRLAGHRQLLLCANGAEVRGQILTFSIQWVVSDLLDTLGIAALHSRILVCPRVEGGAFVFSFYYR